MFLLKSQCKRSEWIIFSWLELPPLSERGYLGDLMLEETFEEFQFTASKLNYFKGMVSQD